MVNYPQLDVVVVTYNRRQKLERALGCYENQHVCFRNLIVVNNCSTDDTKEFLDEWQKIPSEKYKKIVILSSENVGGAGGFYLGEEKAMSMGADWVFVADDDAYAEEDMIEKFYLFVENHEVQKISAICAAVLNMDGSYCLFHRGNYYIKQGVRFEVKRSIEADYEEEFFPNNYISYVGTFLSGWALKKVGLCNRKYFIYYDDTEHSIRLSKVGEMICVPAIKIKHESAFTNIGDDVLVSWREYYGLRNSSHMVLKHYPICYLNNWRCFIRDLIIRKEKFNIRSKLIYNALTDALFSRLGKHRVYQPDWKIRKSHEG